MRAGPEGNALPRDRSKKTFPNGALRCNASYSGRPVFISSFTFWEKVIASVGGLLFPRSAGRRALLLRRANRNVIAESAHEAGLRRKIARANIRRRFLNFRAHLLQLLVVARRAHRLIVLQIMERKLRWIPIERFTRRERIDA